MTTFQSLLQGLLPPFPRRPWYTGLPGKGCARTPQKSLHMDHVGYMFKPLQLNRVRKITFGSERELRICLFQVA